jgi:hypothetical protein
MRLSLLGFMTIMCAAAADGFAQTIQLPSFSTFSVDTTVLVPDSGAGWAAGSKRGSSGTSSFGGVGRQRAAGSNRQAAGMHVLAKIHDPAEADQALSQKAQARTAPVRGAGAVDPSAPATTDLARAATDLGLKSVTEIERQRAARSSAQQREALAFYEKGRRAAEAGKSRVAAMFFRTASKQATGAVKQEIDADLKALEASRPATPLSKSRVAR